MNLVNSLMMTNWEEDVNYPYVVDKVLEKLKNLHQDLTTFIQSYFDSKIFR